MTATFTSTDPESDRCPRCGALLARDIVRLRVQYEALMAAALAAVRGHNIVISNGGTGWSRHVEEPLWQLRKAMAMDRMIQNRTQAGPITDDMIERGAEAICNEAEHVKPSGTVWGPYRRRARTALEAALRGKKE